MMLEFSFLAEGYLPNVLCKRGYFGLCDDPDLSFSEHPITNDNEGERIDKLRDPSPSDLRLLVTDAKFETEL